MIINPSPNYDERKSGKIKYLILHYTGMATGKEALDRLCDPEASVSAHYLIEEDGQIFSLVDEEKRAWHAGVSKWEEDTDINDLSIGIEIVNTGHPYPGYESVYQHFPEAQMEALIPLAQGIVRKHNIKPWHVLGHSDVAWRRKIDPGELFDWQRMATEGVGLWPGNTNLDDEVLSQSEFLQALTEFGYDTDINDADISELISAFQRHYRPTQFDGIIDIESSNILKTLRASKIN